MANYDFPIEENWTQTIDDSKDGRFMAIRSNLNVNLKISSSRLRKNNQEETPDAINSDQWSSTWHTTTVYGTYPVQVRATAKTIFLCQIGREVAYIRVLYREMTLQRSLFSNKQPKFCFTGLHIWSFFGATLNQTVPMLSNEKKSGIVFVPDGCVGTGTADSKAQLGAHGDGRRYSTCKILMETTGTTPELVFDVMAWKFIQISK